MLFQQRFILTRKDHRTQQVTEVKCRESGTLNRRDAIHLLSYYQSNWPQYSYYVVSVWFLFFHFILFLSIMINYLCNQSELIHKKNVLANIRTELSEVMSVDDKDTYSVLIHLDEMISDMEYLID